MSHDNKNQIEKIHLSASELASFIGLNPYQHPKNIMVKMWKKYYPSQYYTQIHNLDRVGKEYEPCERPNETLNRLTQKHKIPIPIELKKCFESKNAQQLQKNQKELICRITETDIPKKESENSELLDNENISASGLFDSSSDEDSESILFGTDSDDNSDFDDDSDSDDSCIGSDFESYFVDRIELYDEESVELEELGELKEKGKKIRVSKFSDIPVLKEHYGKMSLLHYTCDNYITGKVFYLIKKLLSLGADPNMLINKKSALNYLTNYKYNYTFNDNVVKMKEYNELYLNICDLLLTEVNIKHIYNNNFLLRNVIYNTNIDILSYFLNKGLIPLLNNKFIC